METKRILSASLITLLVFLSGGTSSTTQAQNNNAPQSQIESNNANTRFLSSIHAINLFLLDDNSDNTNDTGDSDFSDSSDWLITASTSRDILNAIDGIDSSRWTTRETQRDNQFYQIDFGSIKTFDRIVLDSTASSNDYPRVYEVLVSTDGSNWQSVASGVPVQQDKIEVIFNQQNARFLRIEQSGSDDRHWWSIHELSISLGPIEESPTDGLHPDIVRVADIPLEDILREPGGEAWKDSYSVGDRCYCDTTGDHDVNNLLADTPFGTITTEEACDLIGPGPGSQGNPIYNDIQCGNGPANDAGDEDYCPGRVDIGKEGCTHIGPKWNFSDIPPQGDSITCSDEFGLPECMETMSNNGGGVIHLEAKTYQLSDALRLRDNVDIIGQGKGTIIRFTDDVANTIDEPLLLGLGVNDIELKDFTLRCSIDQDPDSEDIRNDHMGIYMDGPGDPSKGESTNNNNVRMERIEAYHCSNGMHLKGLTGFIGIDLDLHHNGNTERDLFHNIYLRRVADVHMSQTGNNTGGYYASNRGHGLRLSHIDNAYFGNLAVYDNADHGVHMTDGVFNMRFYNLRNNNNCADFAGACGEFRCYGGSDNCNINDNAPQEEAP